ncbi:hypothetical protein [Novosphingobium sp.]|uniref:hypothetical protein n=1 Tax=Novosphingobium sp. TaxID=1874826 RepID=UPI00260F9449|nr:hypothetical protein [Novosphingobium sp.]
MARGAALRAVALLAPPLLLAGPLLSGCVEKIAESRVRSALVGAGLSEATSDCMAKRMVDRLTISQLRKLQALQGPKRSVADYVAAVRKVGDRQVLEVTASSAALCATGFG